MTHQSMQPRRVVSRRWRNEPMRAVEQRRYQAQQRWKKQQRLRDKYLRQIDKETNPRNRRVLSVKARKAHTQMAAIQKRFPNSPMGIDEISGSIPVEVKGPTVSLPPEPLPNTLSKYTDRAYAESMIAAGELLIRPASQFENAENPARQDDELTAHNRELELAPVHHPLFTITGNGGLTYEMTVNDYYIWCSAKSLRRQLFAEFDVDSFVVVFDAPQFLSRLRKEFESRNLTFGCHSAFYHGDRINSFEGPFFYEAASKYANQDEYRVVGIPEHGEMGNFFVKIGSLNEIAKVATIEDCPS